MVFNLFRIPPRRTAIAALYERIATASRDPGLYEGLGVPDTLEGRFESVSLHVILALRALRSMPDPAQEVARDLAEAFFRDMDSSLREMGVGDTRVPKRMKSVASAFYGRAHAYDAPLDAGDEAVLALTLGRNVQGQETSAPALARYVVEADSVLHKASLDAVLKTGFAFPQPDLFVEAGS